MDAEVPAADERLHELSELCLATALRQDLDTRQQIMSVVVQLSERLEANVRRSCSFPFLQPCFAGRRCHRYDSLLAAQALDCLRANGQHAAQPTWLQLSAA